MSELNKSENSLVEDKNVEISPVVETIEDSPASSTVETVEEPATDDVDDKKKKTKSFFSIFKKDKPEEVEAEETTDAEVAEAEETGEVAEASTSEEVPVESTPAKKGLLCGLCACSKKKQESVEETPDAETTEEAAVAEESQASEEEAVTEEATVVKEASAVEESEVEAEADVVRSGTLFKSGKFFKSKFNERNCRILASGLFQWSKTEEFSKANECKIDAETTTVAFVAEGEDAPHKYRFELHCCGEVYTYAVDTEEERDEWIRAFETVKESNLVPEASSEEVVAEVSEEAPVADSE